jgi:hypothetical protein
MTKTEFMTLCQERTIDPSLALENDAIIEALQAKDDDKVVELLNNEF